MRTPTQGEFTGRLWLYKGKQRLLGKGRVQLLGLIAEHGSITKAAKAMGMSYKAAWEAVEMMNNLSDAPLVTRVRGGAGGGETRLTDYGHELVRMFRAFQDEHGRFLSSLSQRLQRVDSAETQMRRFGMRTSARNQLWGRVDFIQCGAVNSEVTLETDGGVKVVASITNESVKNLDLKEGKAACALIKASFVILAPADAAGGLRTSARNRFTGRVSKCTTGTVNGEVTVDVGGNHAITATVTNESIRALELAVGKQVHALVKASHVILAVNDG